MPGKKLSKAERLLKDGYFPAQLPPAFVTESLAKKRKLIYAELKKIINNDLMQLPKTQFAKYSIARSLHNRRLLAIPNPIIQIFLCHEISSHWKQLTKHFKKSKISVSTPEFRLDSKRATEILPISDLQEKRHFFSSGKKFILVSDISRFFPSIYTHSLAWTLHEKALCKLPSVQKDYKKYLGNRLDLLARKCQDNQTVGIPVGPDTSHILAELVAVSVDVIIKSQNKKLNCGYRHVDDFYFAFQKYEDAENALKIISQAAMEYELDLNENKTRILSVLDEEENNWTTNLKSFVFTEADYEAFGSFDDPFEFDEKGYKKAIAEEKNQIYAFFQSAFEISKKYGNYNVMKFALKRSAHVKFHEDAWKVYESYLFRIGRVFPNVLQIVCELLFTYKKRGYTINQTLLQELVFNTIQESAPLEKHSELAWALWIAKEFSVKITKSVAQTVLTTTNPICVLIFLDLQSRGLIPKSVNTQRWKNLLVEDSLKNENWLLAYESAVKGWLKPKDPNFIKKNKFFNVLRKHKISFYDTKKKTGLFLKLEEHKMLSPSLLLESIILIDDDEYID